MNTTTTTRTVARKNETRNAQANRLAYQQMSILERETGKPPEYWARFHSEQRARVRARYRTGVIA